MEEQRTSVFSNGLIWFGAAVSIAEILTGTLIAPLGFNKGLMAILIGHIIGCILLYYAGIIGSNTKKSSMDTVKIAFGKKGSYLFSSLNVLQLVGWTAVMIASGSNALNSIIPFSSPSIWHLVIGGLILLWVLIGLKTLNRLNSIAMIGLFILTIILSFVIFKDGSSVFIGGKMSFGSAIELSVAMPLSWLPLISDYTRNAENGSKSTFVSVAVYFVISSWMYVIGMGAALFTGESDVAKIMLQAGLGIAGILIILFSTVTTTYLDVYSAGVSSSSISEKLREKPMAVIVTIIGTIIAIFVPIAKFESFLYFISSVFAPMIAILISDYFILKKDASSKSFNLVNLCIWLIGFIAYRKFMGIDTFFGSTLPVMFVVAFLCVIVNKISGGTKNA